MLPWQPFDVVRCLFALSKIQLLNHSIYHGSIYHLLVFILICMPLRPMQAISSSTTSVISGISTS